MMVPDSRVVATVFCADAEGTTFRAAAFRPRDQVAQAKASGSLRRLGRTCSWRGGIAICPRLGWVNNSASPVKSGH